MLKWLIIGGILFLIYRLYYSQETTSKPKKNTKINYNKVKDAEFEDHE
tara:strand:- start:2546 stop:2689 length:144 start_codon:yes stop_codon:yes gene_type:complete